MAHSIDAMSTYSHAVAIKSDRVDYSVTKGGFRLWTTLLLFFLLLGGLANFLSDTEDISKLADALDFDDDGDHDNVDDDDSDVQIHESKRAKHEADGRDKSRVTRPGHGSLGDSREDDDSSTADGEGDDEDDKEDGHVEGHEDWETEDHDEEVPKPTRETAKDDGVIDDKDNDDDDDDEDDDRDDDDDEDDNEVAMLSKIGLRGKSDVAPEDRAQGPDVKSAPRFQRLKGKLVPQKKGKAKATVPVDADDDDADDDEHAPDAKSPPRFQRVRGKKPVEKKIETHDKAKKEEKSRARDDEEDSEDDENDEDTITGDTKNTTPKFERRKGKSSSAKQTKREIKNIDVEDDHDDDEDPDEIQQKSDQGVTQKRRNVTPTATRQSKEGIRARQRRSTSKADEELDLVPDPNAPVRYFRKHGALQKDADHDEENGDAVDDDIDSSTVSKDVKSKAQKPASEDDNPGLKQTIVRFFRAKGSSRDSADRKGSGKATNNYDDDDDNDQEHKADDRRTPTSKGQKRVRYFRIKGGQRPQGSCTKENCRGHVSGREGSDTQQDTNPGGGREASAHNGVTQLVPFKVAYRKAGITNRDDNKIRHLLDEADRLLDENKLDEAIVKYKNLVDTYKRSPRASYGLAKTLERLSDKLQSNEFLEQCIELYERVLMQPYVPDDLYLLVVERLVDRARFRGWMEKAANAQSLLVERFPDRTDLRNGLGVTFLMMGRNDDAKKVFNDVLSQRPENGFAQAHYGFILKTIDNDLKEGVEYLKAGIISGQEGTQDGRLFFHLGEALQRLGRRDEAYEIYDLAAVKGLFLSKYQRSLHNIEDLTAKPWWSVKETGYEEQLRELERNWKAIGEEGTQLLKTKAESFLPEDDRLTDSGRWRRFVLFHRGTKVDRNCLRAPKTCQLLSEFPEAALCTRGQVEFSVMDAGTKTFPHCGSTNCHLRGHLGLIVPAEPRIRVANETRSWKPGKFIIFDDSFEHEEWHNGHGIRMVLSVDFWHPELTSEQRASLEPV